MKETEEKSERTYTNDNQQTLMRMVEYLGQDILMPKTLKELHEALNISRDQAFRTVWNLMDMGWAEEAAQGYRLSPRIVEIADRLRRAVADTLIKYLPNQISPRRNGNGQKKSGSMQRLRGEKLQKVRAQGAPGAPA